MIEIVQAKPSLAKETFKALTELVEDPNKSLNYAAIWSLVEIIERKPNIAIEVFIGVKELIINSNIDKLY
ncbi:hypothetical protein [Rickettsia rhipicephali]|uniref:hypothetical protein n=1 Tax=Rickettsia rhipicephali TaxID=33992 RepID=UPI000B2439F4|nr:hypothetical protein [Rickettsia rhipicephali]